MEDKLIKCLTGFRKLHSTQHSLLTMFEIWKRGTNNEACVFALFMDLSEAFDTIMNLC